MRTLVRSSLAGAALAGAVWLAAGPGSADTPKKGAGTLTLPADVFKELASRTAQVAQEGLAAADENGLSRARASAVLIAVGSYGVQGGDAQQTTAVRLAALELAKLTRDKKMAEARKLAATLAAGKLELEDKSAKLVLDKEDLADLMNLYRMKAKGGEGLPPALQNPAPFKTAKNGIEEKVLYLAKKELKPEILDKEADELALLGYKLAVGGELTDKFPPTTKVDKKDPADWHRFSAMMRDGGVQLAEAAKKKDAAAVKKAADTLSASCLQCHQAFR